MTVAAVSVALVSACSNDTLDDAVTSGAGASGSTTASSPDSAQIEQGLLGEDVSVNVLDDGDCFDEPASIAGQDAGNVRTVRRLPCAQEHDSEVYYLGVLQEEEAYPGPDQVEDLVIAACIDQFASFVGAPYETSDLEISYLYPGEVSWQENDRSFICSVFDLNGNPLQGSMADSGY